VDEEEDGCLASIFESLIKWIMETNLGKPYNDTEPILAILCMLFSELALGMDIDAQV